MDTEKREKYYKFENGIILKYDLETLDFYRWQDGVWVIDKRLIPLFYDAAIKCVEIENPCLENEKRKER